MKKLELMLNLLKYNALFKSFKKSHKASPGNKKLVGLIPNIKQTSISLLNILKYFTIILDLILLLDILLFLRLNVIKGFC